MKLSNRNIIYNRMLAILGCFVVLLVMAGLTDSYGASSPKTSVSPQEEHQLGERMYREGILPSGEPMQAFVKGDLPVPGTAFTCVSCHLRSGLGSYEGGVVTTPTNGAILFKPLDLQYKGVKQDPKYYPVPTRRPAYTDKTLANVIQSGVDPTGRTLNDVMPRYLIEDQDMALLVSYLKNLSSHFSPGVSDTTIHFATVITDDVSPEERNAMLVPLENYIKQKNTMAAYYKRNKFSARMAASMLYSGEMTFKKLSLSKWVLKGPAETWRSQLEEYNRKDPVFALLGGITNGDWQPIHEFCETNRIPCIFPITDYPVVSETDWYTLYFSKGYYQEGEAAARYLNRGEESQNEVPIVQIVRDSKEGKNLSAGFQETWRELGHQDPTTVRLKTGETLSEETLQQILAKEKPAVLVLWDGAESLPALELLANNKEKPQTILVSSSYLGKSVWKLGKELRDITYITYPYRLPQDEERYNGFVGQLASNMKLQGKADMIAKESFAITQLLTLVMMDIRGNYYRDNLLDVIGMMRDQDLPLYERLSFGPGQRYASKGCYIVQLSKGDKPELVKKSDWVIH